MNRIETKIIIMVTNRLAAAKDSDAKTEMIEELSENLYQRYLELVESGIAEDVALQQALDSLGDVDELLSFLSETEGNGFSGQQAAKEQDVAAGSASAQDAGGQEPAWETDADGQDIGKESGASEENASSKENSSSFTREDFENGIEEIVNAAISAAKEAVDCTKNVAKDVSVQIKEMYSDGRFQSFTSQRSKRSESMTIPVESVNALEINMTNGDIALHSADGEDIEIEISGDVEEVETMLKGDGILSIGQRSTASTAFFFMRGVKHADVEVLLPKKVWESVALSTVNGDIEIEDELICRKLIAKTTSGDLNMERVSSERIELKQCSGDIHGEDLSGNVHAESKSGEIEISGTLGRCELFSVSGSVRFEGECQEANCSSTSGDVELDLANLPEKIKCNSISGNCDCEFEIPEGKGFRLSYRTVSGRFSSDLPLEGRIEEKRGDAVYGENVSGQINLSSVSGDIRVCGK